MIRSTARRVIALVTVAVLGAAAVTGWITLSDRSSGSERGRHPAKAASAEEKAEGSESAYKPDTGPRVRVNQVGYLPDGPKNATVVDGVHGPAPLAVAGHHGAGRRPRP